MEKIKTNLSIIYIMWLRQIKRHFRSKFRVVASIGQPLLFLVALGFGFGPIYERAGGGNFIDFLAPGIIAMSIVFSAVFSGLEVISDKQFGFLKETMVAPVSRVVILIGRTFGGATTSSFQGLMVFLISLLLGFRPVSLFGFLVGLVFMVLTALFFTILGTSIASFFDDMHAFPMVMNFMVMPMFFLSGALFPLSGSSTVMAKVAAIDPMTYGVDGIRGALSNMYHYSFITDFTVLLILILIMLFLGSKLFSRIEV